MWKSWHVKANKKTPAKNNSLQEFLLLFARPSRFFAQALISQKLGWAIFFVVAVSFFFSLILVGSDRTLTPHLMKDNLAKMFPAYTAMLLVVTALYAFCTVHLGRLFNGKATFKTAFIVAAYATGPFVLLAWPYTLPIGLIWACALSILGLRIAHGIALVRAVLVQSIFVAVFMLIVSLLLTSMLGGKRSYPAEQLVHKPAPDVLLQPFDGEPVRLSALKGKSVVLLDFWATWCPPCRQSLPILSEIADDFRDQGVVVYAVANDQDPQQSKEYLKALNLALNGVVGSVDLDLAFLVEALPETVVIDKNGVVQAVHVGVSAREKEVLTSDLRRCLSQ